LTKPCSKVGNSHRFHVVPISAFIPGAPHVAVAGIADAGRIVEEPVRELRHWRNLSDGVPVGSLRNEPAIVTFQKTSLHFNGVQKIGNIGNY
jgi:hypothetical protein